MGLHVDLWNTWALLEPRKVKTEQAEAWGHGEGDGLEGLQKRRARCTWNMEANSRGSPRNINLTPFLLAD